MLEEFVVGGFNAAALGIVEREGLAVNVLFDVILRNVFSAWSKMGVI